MPPSRRACPTASRPGRCCPCRACCCVGASGLGCLRVWFAPGTHAADIVEARACLAFICGVSGPLSVLLAEMLRRGYPVRPNLNAATAGLAAAAAAATLLNFFHLFDAAATDLVVLANRVLAGRAFGEAKA
nr:NrsF family protein [uncultured Rhodopila sp.]